MHRQIRDEARRAARSPSCWGCCGAIGISARSGENLAGPVCVYLALKTLDEHSDNRRSEDRLIVERLQNAVSQTRQTIVRTRTVIHEARRLIGLAEKIGRPDRDD